MRHFAAEVLVCAQCRFLSRLCAFKNDVAAYAALLQEKVAAAVVFDRVVFGWDRSDVPGAAVAAVVETAIDDDPGAKPRSKCDPYQVTISSSLSIMKFSKRKTIRVVVYMHGNLKNFL